MIPFVDSALVIRPATEQDAEEIPYFLERHGQGFVSPPSLVESLEMARIRQMLVVRGEQSGALVATAAYSQHTTPSGHHFCQLRGDVCILPGYRIHRSLIALRTMILAVEMDCPIYFFVLQQNGNFPERSIANAVHSGFQHDETPDKDVMDLVSARAPAGCGVRAYRAVRDHEPDGLPAISRNEVGRLIREQCTQASPPSSILERSAPRPPLRVRIEHRLLSHLMTLTQAQTEDASREAVSPKA